MELSFYEATQPNVETQDLLGRDADIKRCALTICDFLELPEI